MATIKIKFRSSSISTKEGTLYFQVIHKRVVRQINIGYKLYAKEWNNHLSEFVLPVLDNSRRDYLTVLKEKLSKDIHRLKKVIATLERKEQSYTADDVIIAYSKIAMESSFFIFMKEIVVRLKQLNKVRTSETYAAALSSFKRFREGNDLALDEINSDLMVSYEVWLKTNDVSMNTVSFYMRILRAAYNRAVEKELIVQRYPFKHVYTGVDKTVKRAIPLKIVKQIKELDLTLNPPLDYVRDMFLFSFYTRGMAFVDMAYLKKNNLDNGVLSYRRRKTGQQLYIRWEKCMQEIIDKYNTEKTFYLLPIIKHIEKDERKQYKNASHLVNRKLKIIGSRLGLSIPLTMYVARHAWASIAKSKNIPVSVISESMGHDSETTTQIYLTSLDTMVVDKANSLILKCL